MAELYFNDLCSILNNTRDYISKLEKDNLVLSKSLEELNSKHTDQLKGIPNSLYPHYVPFVFIPEVQFVKRTGCTKCHNGFIDEHIREGNSHKTYCDCYKDRPLYTPMSYPVSECTATAIVYTKNNESYYVPVENLISTFDETQLLQQPIFTHIEDCKKYCLMQNGECYE